MSTKVSSVIKTRALSMFVVVALLSFPLGAAFASDEPVEGPTYTALQGTGTPNDPLIINECAQLNHVNVQPSSSYLVQNYLYCSGVDVQPIDNFTGAYFDGAGYEFRDLAISDSENNKVGIFRHISEDSVVQNIQITYTNSIDTTNNSSPDLKVGFLAGENDGTIRNVNINRWSNDNTIASSGTVGGLVGVNNGTIRLADVRVAFTMQAGSNNIFGGIAGINNGTIEDAGSTITLNTNGTPVVDATCGGLVGQLNGGTINLSFSTGTLRCNGTGSTGGLVGSASSGATITDSFASISNGGLKLKGAIVGSNPDQIDLTSTYYNGIKLTSETCDDSSNVTCTKALTADYFHVTSSPVYTNWDFEDKGAWNAPYPWSNQDYYLPQSNFYNNATPNSVVVTKVQATPTTAKFTWNKSERNCAQCDPYQKVFYDIYVGIVPAQNGEEAVNVDYTFLNTVESPENYWEESSFEVSNLDPDVYYDYIIVPRNRAGEGVQSESIEIKPVPQAINAPEIMNTQSGAIQLQWDNISNIAERYIVDYKKSTDVAWSTRTTNNFPASNSTIYPLEQNTSYDFRVRSSNLRGESPVGASITASTIVQNIHEISSCEELQSINDDLFGYYTLTQDIDCSASGDFNDGEGFAPIGLTDSVLEAMSNGGGFDAIIAFNGTLDGQGHTINDIQVDLQGAVGGLFAFIDGATVKNLTLEGGHVVGSSAQDLTVYTDSPVTMVAGGLSALAANSVIDNVTTNIDIKSTNNDGHVGLSAGLIGGIMPSAFGPGSLETSVSITNSNALGDSAGYVTAGLVGAIIPADVLSIYMQGVTELDQPENLQQALGSIGTRIDVDITDSTTTGDLTCSILCAGIVGINGSDLNISNVTRSGNTGTFEKEISSDADPVLSIIEMFGPISAGAIGINLPLSFNETPAMLAMNNVVINGAINGTATAGLVGVSAPAIKVLINSFIDSYSDMTQSDDGNSDAAFLDVLYSVLDTVSLTKSFNISNVTVNAENNCAVVCTGASLINLGDGVFDNVNIVGQIAAVEMTDELSTNYGETLSMVAMFGPITAGFVGVNLPISTSDSGIGLVIKNSLVASDLSGTAASGLVALSLPGISVDVDQFQQYFAPFWDAISGNIEDRYREIYGDDLWNNETAQREMDQEFATVYGGFGAYGISVITGSTGLDIQNTRVEGDISCSMLCSGAAGISLSKTLIDGFTQVGNIVNDNEQFLFEDNPVSMCPIQITGGVVGSQLFLPLEVKNSTIKGNITVNQTGTIPDDSIASVIDSFFNPSQEEQDNGGPFGTDSLIRLGCALGSSLLQGTGGVTGSFFSPLEASRLIDGTAGLAPATTAEWSNKISNTINEGDISSNSPSATGGLVGISIGKTAIDGSKNLGVITNSTFAEMFRTPIASATTGGLVGHSIGMFSLSGDARALMSLILPIINSGDLDNLVDDILEATQIIGIAPSTLSINSSSSTGNINSSNTAGGLVGTASNGALINKSYATGNVYGVTSGGLVGSGFNMGSPLGILDMFSKLEITNSYARGNIIASDAQDTFTFAGGLVGFLPHFGEFKVANSYATGDISVLNNATDTRLVAGGFVGAELDLSFITQLAEILVEKSGDLTTGMEDYDGYIQMVSEYGNAGLTALSQLGIPFQSGSSITNSFTTSKVPANTQFDEDTLLAEIGSGMPVDGVSSGALYGFVFSIDSQEIRDLIDTALTTLLNSQPSDIEGESPLDSALFEDAMDAITDLNWRDPSSLAPNSFYDGSQVEADRCANSLPTTSELITFLIPKFAGAISGEDGEIDVFSFIPEINKLGGTQCVPVNTDGANDSYFKNNTTVAPLSSWDFSTVWQVQSDDFPTFEPDSTPAPVNPGVITPPGTGTPNPITGGPGSFIPKKVTPADLEKTFTKVKSLLADKPITRTLPKVLGEVTKKLDAEAAGIKDPVDKNDGGLISAVVGIMSATGMFLLRNFIAALFLLTIGGLLTFYGRNKKQLDALIKGKK